MRMAVKVHRWTRADLASLPDDGNRYEVLDGKLFVTPAPTFPHQLIATRLVLLLGPYLERSQSGTVVGPGAVTFGKNELQPDVVAFPVLLRELPDKWEELPRPALVIEVLSSSTSRRDLGVKREAYLRLGIPDYWVIDRFERRALCWTPASAEPRIVGDTLEWRPSTAPEPLLLRLGDILPPG
jgi:Uma2 family endonuclease